MDTSDLKCWGDVEPETNVRDESTSQLFSVTRPVTEQVVLVPIAPRGTDPSKRMGTVIEPTKEINHKRYTFLPE